MTTYEELLAKLLESKNKEFNGYAKLNSRVTHSVKTELLNKIYKDEYFDY